MYFANGTPASLLSTYGANRNEKISRRKSCGKVLSRSVQSAGGMEGRIRTRLDAGGGMALVVGGGCISCFGPRWYFFFSWV